MVIFFYDKTFAGLLTVIFDAYTLKMRPDNLLEIGAIAPLLADEQFTSVTNQDKAGRVWRALLKKIPPKKQWQLTYAWLYDSEEVGMVLFRYICKIFDSPRLITDNYADDDVRKVVNWARKVGGEYHAIAQFSRFQKSEQDLFFAPVSPRYDVLPLVIEHFRQRFCDQKWILYDELRQYGYYYDRQQISEIQLNDDQVISNGRLNQHLLSADEKQFQQLWQIYYKSITIKERLNLKQQRRCMPRRFWRYLIEMDC